MTDTTHPASAPHEPVVWINGNYSPVSQARVSPFDRGFLFGDGIFETIRVQDGKIMYLEDHILRLQDSAIQLNIPMDRGIDWDMVIKLLISQNKLDNGLARVKIILTRGCAPGLGLPYPDDPTCMVLAEKYLPPSLQSYGHGWDIVSTNAGPSPPLAKYKSLNFLYYMITKQEAIDEGAHEALIMDKDGFVAETSTASLIACDSRGWFTPLSSWQLPGTALKQVIRLMEEQGWAVIPRNVGLTELKDAKWVWATNSLMGIMPVHSIDGAPLKSRNRDMASALRNQLFGLF